MCFCEENVVCLLVDFPSIFDPDNSFVWVLTNRSKQCLVGQQGGRAVVWDYHVVLENNGLIFDHNSSLPWPCPVDLYLDKAILLGADRRLQTAVRRVRATDFLRQFSSDRSHMLENGQWLAQPPPWEPFFKKELGNTLFSSLLNFDAPLQGSELFEEIEDLERLKKKS